jgi:hypothetical protein
VLALGVGIEAGTGTVTSQDGTVDDELGEVTELELTVGRLRANTNAKAISPPPTRRLVCVTPTR